MSALLEFGAAGLDAAVRWIAEPTRFACFVGVLTVFVMLYLARVK